MLSKSYILLWQIKTTILKRFYYSYLWILRRRKMVYFIKPLVASSETPQTFHAIFLPRPLNAETVSQPVIAHRNGTAQQISSTKHFAYSRIVLTNAVFNLNFINTKIIKAIKSNNYNVCITTCYAQLLIAFSTPVKNKN